ncbi:MAG: ACT domain-containing protein [Spirochaetales bacterium]|nr:ACT domain-containing protein [Spirochaetales bacterium]
MPGETNLDKLLSSMSPVLRPQTYVFLTLREATDFPFSPLALFQEQEGCSLIVEQEAAMKAGYFKESPMRLITLEVHSSLEAVGLTAAISTRLAAAGISANVVAAYHHDHVFVPAPRAEEALALLQTFER